jgi:integrase
MPVRLRRGKLRDTWQIDVSIKGHDRVKFSAPEARTKRDALLIEASVIRQIYEGKWGKESGSESFAAFFNEKYLPWAKDHKRSWDTDERLGRMLVEYFGGRAFKDFSPLLVEKFKKHLRDTRKYQPASTNRVLALLSKVFTMARDEGYTKENPLTKVRREVADNARSRYLLDGEEEKLFESLSDGRLWILFQMVRLDLHTGLRFGELRKLEFSRHVNFEADALTLTPDITKEGRRRLVPFNNISRQIARELFEDKSPYSDKVFRITRSSAQWHYAQRVKAAGLVNFTFHDLRRTFATRLLEAGVMEYVISALLGHKVRSMTGRYAIATPELQRDAVNKLVQKTANESREVRKIGEVGAK